MENEIALKVLSDSGFRITRKTTLDSICEKMTELGHEFYYEWARELKAFALPVKAKATVVTPVSADRITGLTINNDPCRWAPWS